jgi:hypothetical protein
VLIAHRSMLLVFFHCGWDRGCALYKELGGFWFRPNKAVEDNSLPLSLLVYS